MRIQEYTADSASFILRQKAAAKTSFTSGAGARQNVELAMTAGTRLALAVNAGVSSLDLDLTPYRLDSLVVDSGLLNAVIRFGAPDGDIPVKLSSGIANIELSVPRDVALQVTAEVGIGPKDLAGTGLTRQGNVWQSDDYAGAAQRLTIRLDAGIGVVRVTRY